MRLGLIIAVPLAAIAFSVRPAYRVFREHRLKQAIESAEEASRLKDWQAARDRARTALIMKPGEHRAFKIYVEALAETEDPSVAMAAIALIRHHDSTPEDHLRALAILSEQAPQSLALGAYAYLNEKTSLRDNPDLRAAITPFWVKRGQPEIAEKGLREMMPATPSHRFRLALIRSISAQPFDQARIADARQQFAALIRENGGDEALEALELLGNAPGGLAPGEPLPNLPGWVDKTSGAKVIHHLLALNPEIAEKPEQSDAIFQAAINRFASVDPATTAKWLILHDRPEQAVELLEEPSKHRSDAYLARLHALLRLGHREALAEALKNPPASADMVDVEIVNAVLAQGSGDTSAASAAWTRALNQASYETRRNRFLGIARAAQNYGSSQAAEDAWMAAVLMGFGDLPLYIDLYPQLGSMSKKGHSEDILVMSRAMVTFEPGNPDLANNVAYLGLIHGATNPAEAIAKLEKVLSDHPAKTEINSTLMLADLLASNPDRALERLPLFEKSSLVATTTKRMLHACALHMKRKPEEAKALLQDIRELDFMPQEWATFAKLRGEAVKEGITPRKWSATSDVADTEEVPAWRKSLERAEQQRNSPGQAEDSFPELRVPGLSEASKAFDNQINTTQPNK